MQTELVRLIYSYHLSMLDKSKALMSLLLIAEFYLFEKVRVLKEVNFFLNNDLFSLTLLNLLFAVNERGFER